MGKVVPAGPGPKFFLTRTSTKIFSEQNRDQSVFFWTGTMTKIFFDWDRHQNLFLKGPRPKTFSRRDRDQKWLVPLMSSKSSFNTHPLISRNCSYFRIYHLIFDLWLVHMAIKQSFNVFVNQNNQFHYKLKFQHLQLVLPYLQLVQ